MKTDTDAQLLAAIHAGQDGDIALETIISRHGAMVLATCRRITGHHHDAEEAAQAVMLVLHDKAKHGLTVASLPAWMHRVACFVAVRLRDARRRRTGREVGLSPVHEVAAGDGAPEGELARRLDEALDRLPTHYRLPLILHYMESCSFAEIGERLALRAETVAMRVSRARGMMRRHLSVPERSLEFGSLLMVPAPLALHCDVLHPPQQVASLARQYLHRQTITTTMRVAMTGAAAALVGCMILACASGTARAVPAAHVSAPPVVSHNAADPAPLAGNAATHAAVVAAGGDYPRSEFPGPLWQEQLVAELSRPVTLYCPGQPVWGLIDSIGQQTGMVMLADGRLSGFNATIPPMVADGESLQSVLDRIAASAGLEYRMYAGGLLWQAPEPQPQEQAIHIVPAIHPKRADVVQGIQPTAPIISRIYHLADLPVGRSIIEHIDDMMRVKDLHFDRDGYGCEEFDDMIIVTHRADSENALDAVLQPAVATMTDQNAALPGDTDPATSAPEAALFQAMDHPVGPLPVAATRLDAIISAITRDAHINALLEGDSPAIREPLPERPLPLRIEGLPLRFALCQVLEGTGLHAAFRLDDLGGTQHPVLVIGASVPAQVVTRRYPWHAPSPTGATVAAEAADTKNCAIDWFMKNVDAQSWNEDGYQADTVGETIVVKQSLVVLRDLDDQMPRLWAFMHGYRLPPRVPVMPALLIPAERQ